MMRFVSALGLFALLLSAVGCGQSAGRVSGKVSYKGQPVTAGEVHFFGKDKGVGASGKLDAGGAYTLGDPLPAGTYAVYLLVAPPEPGPPGSAPKKAAVAFPARYGDPATSGLSFTVKGGANDIPLELKD